MEAIAHESYCTNRNLESFVVTSQPDTHGSQIILRCRTYLCDPLTTALLCARQAIDEGRKEGFDSKTPNFGIKQGWLQDSKIHDCDPRDSPFVCAVHFVFSKFYCNVPFLVYCSFLISSKFSDPFANGSSCVVV